MSVITLVSIFASQALTLRVTEAEEILKQIAGTGMLYAAVNKSEEALKSAEDLSELAAGQFRKLSPEIQELAELAYVQDCEELQLAAVEKSKTRANISIQAEHGLDRLETISVLAGRPRMVRNYQPNDPDPLRDLPELSGEGHLRLRIVFPKRRKDGSRYLRIGPSDPFYAVGLWHWTPAEFRRARALILQGAFVLPE